MALKTTTEVELINEAPKPAVLTGRIDIIDIVRGVALLGILILNNSNNLKNHGMLFTVLMISSLFPLTVLAQEIGPQYFAYPDCGQTEIKKLTNGRILY